MTCPRKEGSESRLRELHPSTESASLREKKTLRRFTKATTGNWTLLREKVGRSLLA